MREHSWFGRAIPRLVVHTGTTGTFKYNQPVNYWPFNSLAKSDADGYGPGFMIGTLKQEKGEWMVDTNATITALNSRIAEKKVELTKVKSPDVVAHLEKQILLDFMALFIAEKWDPTSDVIPYLGSRNDAEKRARTFVIEPYNK
jgi:hypothetical protein